MKLSLALAAGAAIVLTGCVGEEQGRFEASAPQEPRPPLTKIAHDGLDQRIAHHAKLNGVPETLVHAVVQRESKYDPALKHGPYWGLMQIRHDTARSMGYEGPARGLLDAETNLTYAVAYLANAYRISGGDERRAIRLYAGGYYYEAKRKGMLGELRPAPASQIAAQEPPPETR
jgi:soluble lytic murein transglycosylase-like protein